MTFFYNLNKTLDAIREKPETTHGQLNERDMGKHNNKTTGFKAVADKATKEYGSKAAGERVAGAVKAKMAKAGKLEEADLDEGFVDTVKSGAQAALGAIGQTMGHGSDEDMIRDLQKKAGLPQTGKVPPQQAGQQGQLPGPGQQPVAEDDMEEGVMDWAKQKYNQARYNSAAAKIGSAKTPQERDALTAKARQFGQSANAAQVQRTGDIRDNPNFGGNFDQAAAINKQYAKEGVNKKAFAALAEPKDKITFADKIAGAKKEVDEMLGDVAAEAMKNALSGGQKKLDKNMNGKLDGQDFAMLRKGGKKQVADEGFPTVAGARAEMNKRKVGDVTHGAKHDTEETPTGRRVTRRLDPNTGYSVGSDTDDEGNAKSTEKRGRGRPKKASKAPERVTAKATKHKGGRKEKVEEGPDEGVDLVKLAKVIASCQTREQLLTAQKMANNFLKKHRAGGFSNMKQDMGRYNDVEQTLQQKNRELKGGQELDEKAVSKKQQKFMGMVHATQKGEKAPSKEVAKVAKTMKKSDANDFASTKQKGLPEKAPKKKEKTEKTEESSTVAGSVAPSAGGKSKGGSMIGKGIYDSVNRELEAMISESMNVSVNMSMDEHGEPRKNITVSAEGEAAEQLAQLLNLAGIAAQEEDHGCGCDTSPCSCSSEDELDENQPDWPTDQETIGNDDPLMRRYAGGVNGPKSTGQTTGSPYNRQDQRQGVMGEGVDLGMKLYAELKSFKG